MDINRVILIGRLVRDPELRTTSEGVPLAKMRIAVNRRPNREGDSQADFIDMTAWRRLAELCDQYLHKGSRVAVDGSIRQRSWQDKEGQFISRVEIEIQNIQFLDPRGEYPAENNQSRTSKESSDEDDSTLHVLDNDLDDDLDEFVFEGGDAD